MRNEVLEDGVIKEQITKEETARDKWNDKWGFMAEEYKISLEYAATLGMSESKYREKISLRKFNKDQNQMNATTRTAVPIKSSAFVGWKVKENRLEKYGPMYVNAKLGINCPTIEQLPVTQVTIL